MGKACKSFFSRVDYGAGLQALGPLLSDAFSDKGDKGEKSAGNYWIIVLDQIFTMWEF